MPQTALTDHDLAERILMQALDDLRREAVRVGRLELLEALLPDLLGQPAPDERTAASPRGAVERRLALARLRERLRERVNARLRELEPDPIRRRALRHRLLATHPSGDDAQ